MKNPSREVWDVLDSRRQGTGRVVGRDEELTEGDYHLIVHVWIQDRAGRYLITQRSPQKKYYPGLWEVTGGCVLAGEASPEAALREVREETGLCLDPRRLSLFASLEGQNKFSPHFLDVYLARADFGPEDIVLQPGETVAFRIVEGAEILGLLAARAFIPDIAPYAKGLVWQ